MSLLSRMAIAIAACCCTSIANAADLRTIVDQAIEPIMKQYDVPGIAVAVTVDGKASFFNYGLASKQTAQPVNEHTLFELGSVTKTFTATMASYAIVQGKLSLNEHPSRYMPQLKGSAIDKASVLNLATYSAGGLPQQFPENLAVDEQHMLAYYRNFKPKAAPGTWREYSNPSLGLFGHVASLALKESSADVIEGQILPKLGMQHTYLRLPDSALPDYAWGYTDHNRAVRMGPDVFAAETYGVRSSSSDMIRYVQVNIDPSALEAPLQQAIIGTHVGYSRTGPMVQGLGWERYPYPASLDDLQTGNSYGNKPGPTKMLTPPLPASDNIWYNKTGATGGFGAYVAFVPAKKIGIVILANKNYPIPERVKAAYAILSQLAPKEK